MYGLWYLVHSIVYNIVRRHIDLTEIFCSDDNLCDTHLWDRKMKGKV